MQLRACLGVSLVLSACSAAKPGNDPNGTFNPTAASTGSTEGGTTGAGSTGGTPKPKPSGPGSTTGSTTGTATGATDGTTTGATGPTGPSLPPPQQDGTWEFPFLPELPSIVSGDTTQVTTNDALSYSCAPSTNEGGPEIVYKITPTQKGILTASVNDLDGDQVDIDVHLLNAAEPAACVARNNKVISSVLEANTPYWVVADTWVNGSNKALAGPFTLTLAYQEISDPGPGANGCPGDMIRVGFSGGTGDFCMDLYEAPNRTDAKPLVMYNLNESEAWCAARGKRLCYDDEWTWACAGPQNWAYPYGNTFDSEKCNVDKQYKFHNETLIGQWPSNASSTDILSLDQLLTKAHATSPASADHVEAIYQGEFSGARATCKNVAGVYDLTGSVEEWTKRRDGGFIDKGNAFTGNLKGRFWVIDQPRTCQSNLRGSVNPDGTYNGHADAFRFYEIGFRCCQTPN